MLLSNILLVDNGLKRGKIIISFSTKDGCKLKFSRYVTFSIMSWHLLD